MQTFRDVIERWPDAASFAADLGVSPALVRKWKERNILPASNWATVIKAAKARRITGVSADVLVRLAAAQKAA